MSSRRSSAIKKESDTIFARVWNRKACRRLASDAILAVWLVAPAAHFRVYSNAGPDATAALASGFERLHALFERQLGVAPRELPVRVICFATESEFAEFRTRPNTSAFSITATGGNYIVMPAGARGDLRISAHEYTHLLLHSTGWKLPLWISEGISEVASTLRIGERAAMIGGESPRRVNLLHAEKRIPLADLFTYTGDQEPLFYAQSWAMADLLMLSPRYGPAFPRFLASLSSGTSAQQALAAVYRVTPETLEADLRARLAKPPFALPLPGLPTAADEIQTRDFDPRSLLEGLRGTVAFERGDVAGAKAFWKRAIDLGTDDAGLCYRYAALTDDRAALERTLALNPSFDDAHYKLALIEKNEGRAEASVAHLRAMREVAPARAFAYWSALSDALLDLGRRPDAKQAAARAAAFASTDTERGRAAELEWLADTELAVQLDGGQARTIRVPVGAPPRNPFIEASDHARREEGTLEQVECGAGALTLRVRTSREPLTLAIPDPSRVQIRNAGGAAFELTCGPQQPRKVLVEYTSSGVLRGLELK